MINIAIQNEQTAVLAQQLGHHNNLQETVETAVDLYLQYLQQQNSAVKKRTVGEYAGYLKLSSVK